MAEAVEVYFEAVLEVCEEAEAVDQDELQLKDEMNTAWVKAWHNALKKAPSTF